MESTPQSCDSSFSSKTSNYGSMSKNGSPRPTLGSQKLIETTFLGFLKVTGVFANKRSIELSCQIENRQVGSRAMFDFMGPSAYLCHADVSCRLPLDDAELFVVLLLYESFFVTSRQYHSVLRETVLYFYLFRTTSNRTIAICRCQICICVNVVFATNRRWAST